MTVMKKIVALLLVFIAVLTLTSCSVKSVMNENAKPVTAEDTSRPGFRDVTAPAVENITEAETEKDTAAEKREAAMAAAKAYLGESDPETGLKYTFSYDGTESVDGNNYEKIRVSVHSDDGTYTVCGYLLYSDDGSITKYEWN